MLQAAIKNASALAHGVWQLFKGPNAKEQLPGRPAISAIGLQGKQRALNFPV
jgi:hypothetical protein